MTLRAAPHGEDHAGDAVGSLDAKRFEEVCDMVDHEILELKAENGPPPRQLLHRRELEQPFVY